MQAISEYPKNPACRICKILPDFPREELDAKLIQDGHLLDDLVLEFENWFPQETPLTAQSLRQHSVHLKDFAGALAYTLTKPDANGTLPDLPIVRRTSLVSRIANDLAAGIIDDEALMVKLISDSNSDMDRIEDILTQLTDAPSVKIINTKIRLLQTKDQVRATVMQAILRKNEFMAKTNANNANYTAKDLELLLGALLEHFAGILNFIGVDPLEQERALEKLHQNLSMDSNLQRYFSR